MLAVRYHWFHRLLHAVMALLIPIAFGIGVWMVELDFYHSWYHQGPELHKAIGVLISSLCVPRIFMLFSRKPIQTRLVKWVHASLYLLLLLVIVSGYLMATAKGAGINVFGLFNVPAIQFLIDDQVDIAGAVHFWSAWSMMILITLHLVAALKHAWLDKDDVMQRMWGFYK